MYTKYALSTIRNYIRKYHNLLDQARKLFEGISLTSGENWFYWIRIYQNGKYLFDKIGETKQQDPKKDGHKLFIMVG